MMTVWGLQLTSTQLWRIQTTKNPIMKRKLTPFTSFQARQIQHQVRFMVLDYETSLGPIPIWFEEIDTCQALSLIAACLRIGMTLSVEETLQEDMRERAIAHRSIRTSRPPGAD